MANKEDMMNRQKFNKAIHRIIGKAIELYPDMRYHQILSYLEVIETGQDDFYTESIEVLRRMKQEHEIHTKGKDNNSVGGVK